LNSNFLKIESAAKVSETVYSHLFRSTCPVTNQPDWASIMIRYQGKKIAHEGLLKYLISYREYNDFGEQCTEHIYMDILRQCAPEKLTVYMCFTRRGGLDINPFRSNFEKYTESIRTYRQ
jgi:7-cyano-7-deazaguanine reductase